MSALVSPPGRDSLRRLLLHWCHSGVGVTPVPPPYTGVIPVPPPYAGVTLVSLGRWCHSGAGVTPVSLQCWYQCHSSAGVIELFKPTINYVYSKIIAQQHQGHQQNNMLNCYVCGDPFTRQFSRKKRKHAQSNVESKKENPKVHNFTENGQKLRHPFTMMVAASTGEGKTWFVKHLLENREQWISPAPQRIIWIYVQWQPLYAQNHTRYRVCERHPSKH